MRELDDPTQAAEFAFKLTGESLKRSSDVDSCVTLASKVDERIEATLSQANNLDTPIACKAGCSFCCHLRVMIRPHEAIALFRYLRSQVPDEKARAIVEKVLANADLIGSMTETEHMSARIPCAFLVDGAAVPIQHDRASEIHPDLAAGEDLVQDVLAENQRMDGAPPEGGSSVES